VLGNFLADCLDVIGKLNFDPDSKVTAVLNHRPQDVERAGIPVNNGASHVVLFKQVEDEPFATLGMEVHEFLLLPRGGQEAFQDFDLRRIRRLVFPVVR